MYRQQQSTSAAERGEGWKLFWCLNGVEFCFRFCDWAFLTCKGELLLLSQVCWLHPYLFLCSRGLTQLTSAHCGASCLSPAAVRVRVNILPHCTCQVYWNEVKLPPLTPMRRASYSQTIDWSIRSCGSASIQTCTPGQLEETCVIFMGNTTMVWCHLSLWVWELKCLPYLEIFLRKYLWQLWKVGVAL